MKEQAKQFTINGKDVVKGFIMAILTMLVTMLFKGIETGTFPSTWNEWQVILLASLGSGLGYLLKNWLTNSNDQFLKKEETK